MINMTSENTQKFLKHFVCIISVISNLNFSFAYSENNHTESDIENEQQICLNSCSSMKSSHDNGLGEFIQCPEFCDFSITEQFLFNISNFISNYVSINSSEQILISKYPKNMFIAFLLASRSLHLCSGVPNLNECKHFLWSVFLYEQLGPEWSKIILNAHEDSFLQDPDGRLIDYYNNQVGLKFAEHTILPEEEGLQDTAIMTAFHQHLEGGQLMIDKRGASTSAFLQGQQTNGVSLMLYNLLYRIYKTLY